MRTDFQAQLADNACDEQPNNDQQKGPGIPLARKLCYAIGGMPYQMTSSAKGFFMQIFLLDIVQMMPFYVSVILFLGRVWDAITDPLVGYMASKSGRTRLGKLIPWIVYSMPMGVIAYIMLWYTPQNNMSPVFSFCWYFGWCCIFDTLMSCYHVPYTSLNMFLGGDQKDRDSATGYRMGMEMLATLAGATIQGQIVGVYQAKKAQACSALNESNALTGNYSSVLYHNSISPFIDTLQDTRRAYLIAALVLGVIYFMCCIVLFLGVKEQLAPLSKMDCIQVSYLTSMKMVVRHKSYVLLVLGFLFSSLAFQITQGNFALFCTHAVGLGAYFQHLVLILLMAAILFISLWQMLLVRLGKKTTIFIGLTIYIPALILLYCQKGNFLISAIGAILAGASLASLYLLPWSMLPDAVDDFKVKNPSCTDLEPLFTSCYVFFNKFGGGMSQGVSTLALYYAGYQPGACRHDSGVITTLKVLFVPVPICLLLIGMVFFYLYPINEQQRLKIQATLRKAVEENTEPRGEVGL
ncbi:sodium-dependent lysophosphatidylcholine symporter 1 isoform X1 [Ictalurus punctatus]|uniref:Sodium-dependent lysophosphatidylcholine symporter 1 isoform X1 n=1 Tax=Ictalurus punctatus TaxID=7998 RepID=A0A2D0SMH3_ICTPU|nr:sodium-dependent lysophosphatidylcholine symporter 1 isoform X1 [Ictalurus punctatus]